MSEWHSKGNRIDMITDDKRYKIDKARKVYVYKNLHRNCYSIKQDGLVKMHTDSVCLWNASFQVGKKGRERVVKEKRKNVHAGVSGYVVDMIPACRTHSDLSYNPKWHKGFVHRLDPDEGVVEYSNYAHLECGDGWKSVEAMWA